MAKTDRHHRACHRVIGAIGTLTGYAGGLHNRAAARSWKAFCEVAATPSTFCWLAIWGASFLFMRVAVPEFGPFALIGLRSGLAALCLWLLLLARSRNRVGSGAHSSARADGRWCCQCVDPFTLFAYAALSLTAGFTGADQRLHTAVDGAGRRVWLRSGLSCAQWCGLALGVLGMVILTGARWISNPVAPASPSLPA